MCYSDCNLLVTLFVLMFEFPNIWLSRPKMAHVYVNIYALSLYVYVCMLLCVCRYVCEYPLCVYVCTSVYACLHASVCIYA